MCCVYSNDRIQYTTSKMLFQSTNYGKMLQKAVLHEKNNRFTRGCGGGFSKTPHIYFHTLFGKYKIY